MDFYGVKAKNGIFERGLKILFWCTAAMYCEIAAKNPHELPIMNLGLMIQLIHIEVYKVANK